MVDFASILNVDGVRADKDVLRDVLTAMREFLDMPSACLLTFTDEGLRAVVSSSTHRSVCPPDNTIDPEGFGFCHLLRAGLLPQIVPDSLQLQRLGSSAILDPGLFRSLVAVPVFDRSCAISAVICCFSPWPQYIDKADYKVTMTLAKIVENMLETDSVSFERASVLRERIRGVIDDARLEVHLQPIIRLQDGTTLGYEALSRIKDDNPYQPPAKWFEDARLVGMRPLLECNAISQAIDLLPFLPRDTYLSINASADTVAIGAVFDLVQNSDPHRIVLELSECESQAEATLDYALAELRDIGVRLALDDHAAGQSSYSAVMRLKPDIIKLGHSAVKTINRSTTSEVHARAMIKLAGDLGAVLIATGIEHESERSKLSEIGVELGQGFLIAHPAAPNELGLDTQI